MIRYHCTLWLKKTIWIKRRVLTSATTLFEINKEDRSVAKSSKVISSTLQESLMNYSQKCRFISIDGSKEICLFGTTPKSFIDQRDLGRGKDSYWEPKVTLKCQHTPILFQTKLSRYVLFDVYLFIIFNNPFMNQIFIQLHIRKFSDHF